jgi:hypothetical protein
MVGLYYIINFYQQNIALSLIQCCTSNLIVKIIFFVPRIAIILITYYITIWVGLIAGILVIPFALIPGIIINTRIYLKIMKYWSRKSRRPNALFVQWDEKQENVLEP